MLHCRAALALGLYPQCMAVYRWQRRVNINIVIGWHYFLELFSFFNQMKLSVFSVWPWTKNPVLCLLYLKLRFTLLRFLFTFTSICFTRRVTRRDHRNVYWLDGFHSGRFGYLFPRNQPFLPSITINFDFFCTCGRTFMERRWCETVSAILTDWV